MVSLVNLLGELLGARPMDVLTGGYHDYPQLWIAVRSLILIVGESVSWTGKHRLCRMEKGSWALETMHPLVPSLPDCGSDVTSCVKLLPPCRPHHSGVVLPELCPKVNSPSFSRFCFIKGYGKETTALPYISGVWESKIVLGDCIFSEVQREQQVSGCCWNSSFHHSAFTSVATPPPLEPLLSLWFVVFIRDPCDLTGPRENVGSLPYLKSLILTMCEKSSFAVREHNVHRS